MYFWAWAGLAGPGTHFLNWRAYLWHPRIWTLGVKFTLSEYIYQISAHTLFFSLSLSQQWLAWCYLIPKRLYGAKQSRVATDGSFSRKLFLLQHLFIAIWCTQSGTCSFLSPLYITRSETHFIFPFWGIFSNLLSIQVYSQPIIVVALKSDISWNYWPNWLDFGWSFEVNMLFVWFCPITPYGWNVFIISFYRALFFVIYFLEEGLAEDYHSRKKNRNRTRWKCDLGLVCLCGFDLGICSWILSW